MSDFFSNYDDTASSNTSTGSSQGNAQQGTGYSGGQGGGDYADEIFSKQIQTKFRRFFIDLKQSKNGKYIKMSEKSNGRKSTIMFDTEDIGEIIAALEEVKSHI
jgi:hypothetical protein